MNGKRAKAIRGEVYGDDFSPKFRKYTGENRQKLSDWMITWRWNQVGTITADPRRQAYQKAKKAWTRRNG